MKEININVKGSYGETNFGDDLLMLVFENYFIKEFQNSNLNFEGINVDYPSNLLQKATYNRKKSDNDWNVYGGGTQFFSFNEKSDLSTLDKVKIYLKNPQLLKNKFVKQKDNTKTALLGFGIGPFTNNLKAIQNAKVIVDSAQFVGVRDEISYNYCNEWNINAVLGADVVFSSYFNKSDYYTSNLEEKRNNKIGIIVRDWDYEESGNSYIEILQKFYRENSTQYQIIVFAPDKDKKWINSMKDENIIVWNPKKNTVGEFLHILNSFDALISARYHGAIIGALLSKPVICIEIEPKLKILTEQVKEMKLWKKPFDIENLKLLIGQLDNNIDYSLSLNERKVLADNMLLEFKNNIENSL